MTDEELKILSYDLAARVPHEVKCQFTLKYGDNGHKEGVYVATITEFGGNNWIEVEYNDTSGASGRPWLRDWSCGLEDIKPYLRPMSSMTEEEFEELKKFSGLTYDFTNGLDLATYPNNHKCLDFYLSEVPSYVVILVFDWLNEHHFDYRGLIERNLAIAVTESNNLYKQEK